MIRTGTRRIGPGSRSRKPYFENPASNKKGLGRFHRHLRGSVAVCILVDD